MNTPDNSAATLQDDDGTPLGFWGGPTTERPGYAIPRTITDVGLLADRLGIKPSEILTLLEQDLGPEWWNKH